MAVSVRQASLADLDAFRFVGFSTCPSTYGPFAGPSFVTHQLDDWWSPERLKDPLEGGDCLIGVQDDTVVGVSEVGEYDGDLVMWKLYVLPSWQRTGVGKSLLDVVKGLAVVRNLPLVTEYVAGNKRAAAFYRSQGFVDTSSPTSPLDTVWAHFGTPRSSR